MPGASGSSSAGRSGSSLATGATMHRPDLPLHRASWPPRLDPCGGCSPLWPRAPLGSREGLTLPGGSERVIVVGTAVCVPGDRRHAAPSRPAVAPSVLAAESRPMWRLLAAVATSAALFAGCTDSPGQDSGIPGQASVSADESTPAD